MHVSRGIHVDKGGLVFGGCFAAGAEFREAWSRAFLGCVESATLPRFSGAWKESTLDKRVSVATSQTSLYFVTSHATEPSKSLTRETGSVARRRAYWAGGSRPEVRLKGKEGSSVTAILQIMRVSGVWSNYRRPE